MASVKTATARAGRRSVPQVKRASAASKAAANHEPGAGSPGRAAAGLPAKNGDETAADDIAGAARKYAVRAIERIAEIMESESNREALAAAFHLLDRAYGKPSGLADDKNSMNEVMLELRESLRAKLARLVA